MDIYTHPNNVEWFKEHISEQFENPPGPFKNGEIQTLRAVKIYADYNIPEYEIEYEFPYDPFVEYEECDRPWLMHFDLMVKKKKMVFYKMKPFRFRVFEQQDFIPKFSPVKFISMY